MLKGKIYDFSGPRTEEGFISFATGGYASAPNVEVPGQPTITDELKTVWKDLTTGIKEDIKRGRYFSQNILMVGIPILFFVVLTLSACYFAGPESEEDTKPEPKKASAASKVAENETDKNK